jgi:16S rRNA processing protein RimM
MVAPADGKAKRIALAAVAGAHGVKGELRLKLFSETIDSLRAHQRLFVGGDARRLVELRDGGKTAIARLEGIYGPSGAVALGGQRVVVVRGVWPPVGDGVF